MKKIIFLISLICSLSASAANFKIHRNDSLVLKYIDSVNYYIDSLDIQEPCYVLAQAILESQWFQCKNCTWENNNMFGFRAKSGKYMKFKSWQECVIYYDNWQKKRYFKYKKLHKNGDYIGFLIWCKYAESKRYSDDIRKIHKWINKNWNKC
jgi:hypothetical protein